MSKDLEKRNQRIIVAHVRPRVARDASQDDYDGSEGVRYAEEKEWRQGRGDEKSLPYPNPEGR